MLEFSERLAVNEGRGGGGKEQTKRISNAVFLFVRRYLVSFEGEMDATTGQTAVATEAQKYKRCIMHTAANKPHKMCRIQVLGKHRNKNLLSGRDLQQIKS
jgi:hypothetical protein